MSDDGAFAELAELSRSDPVRRRLRDRLIRTYLPFARRLARRYRGRGEPNDDLAQVAALGLIKAVDRFDASRGLPFESFAGPTIEGELKRHFRDKGWSVRVSRRMQELALMITRAQQDLIQQLGRTATTTDIADYLDRDEKEITSAFGAVRAYSTESLNAVVNTDGGRVELADLIGSRDQRIESLGNRDALRRSLSELPDREQRILRLRFSADLTQAQIAERVGISQMHVSRLLSRSLARLREKLLAEPDPSTPPASGVVGARTS